LNGTLRPRCPVAQIPEGDRAVLPCRGEHAPGDIESLDRRDVPMVCLKTQLWALTQTERVKEAKCLVCRYHCQPGRERDEFEDVWGVFPWVLAPVCISKEIHPTPCEEGMIDQAARIAKSQHSSVTALVAQMSHLLSMRERW